MRQGESESESEIHFFPLGNENNLGSKSQNENPFRIPSACAGKSICSSLGNENSFRTPRESENSFCLEGKSGKGKCGRAEIGHTAHAANVQIVRIIQMNSRSKHKKCLTGGCGVTHFPFPPTISNPVFYASSPVLEDHHI